ncbi:MAG: hypothetical protein WCJ64_26280, partial [Rhodospirillaceae bacterium]
MSETAAAIAPPPPACTVGPIDEVELCESAADYFAPGARAVIALLLRAPLDAQVLTPTELLHNHKALKTLLALGPVLEAAVERVVAVQGRLLGQSLRSRREAIQAAIDEAVARAAAAEATLDGAAHRGPPFAVLQRDQGLRPGESPDQDYLLLSAVCRELTALRDWGLKLSLLASLAGDDASGRVAALVDGAIADLVAGGAALNRLWGEPPNRNTELRRLLDFVAPAWPLVEKPAAGSGSGSDTVLATLSRLIRIGHLPQARAAVLDLIRRLLRAGEDGEPMKREEEIGIFHDALTTLAGPDGVAGGSAMAEALVTRYARGLDASSNTGLRQAMQGTIETLPDFFSRLHFLAALAGSTLGRRAANELAMLTETLPTNEALVQSAIFQRFDPPVLAEGLARAAAAFDDSDLPPEARRRVQQRITGLVDTMVMRGNFIDLLDHAEPDIPRRIAALRAVIEVGLVSDYGGGPLIEQHILRLTERPETVPAPAGPAPAVVGQPGARFGRHRCPNCFESKSGSGMCLHCGHDEAEGSRPGVHLRAGSLLQGRYVVGR